METFPSISMGKMRSFHLHGRSQEEGKSLATYFITSMQLDRLFEILDAQVVKRGSKADIIAVANLARRCLNLSGRKRPTMREVTAELE
ncbi:unnamed protein product [Prunus armeniaca]